MTYDAYRAAVSEQARIILRRNGRHGGVCLDTLDASFKAALPVEDAAQIVADDTIMWDG
jgi:hypothetical protein